MAAPPVVRFPIIATVRAVGLVVAVLLLTWALHFRGGLALFSDNKDLIFNVHPVLMVIGLVLINGEVIRVPSAVPIFLLAGHGEDVEKCLTKGAIWSVAASCPESGIQLWLEGTSETFKLIQQEMETYPNMINSST